MYLYFIHIYIYIIYTYLLAFGHHPVQIIVIATACAEFQFMMSEAELSNEILLLRGILLQTHAKPTMMSHMFIIPISNIGTGGQFLHSDRPRRLFLARLPLALLSFWCMDKDFASIRPSSFRYSHDSHPRIP